MRLACQEEWAQLSWTMADDPLAGLEIHVRDFLGKDAKSATVAWSALRAGD